MLQKWRKIAISHASAQVQKEPEAAEGQKEEQLEQPVPKADQLERPVPAAAAQAAPAARSQPPAAAPAQLHAPRLPFFASGGLAC